MKRQAVGWRKYLNSMFDKGIASRLYKVLLKLNKKTNKPNFKKKEFHKTRDMNDQ